MFCNSHPRSEDKVSQGASRLRERADVAGRAAAKVFLLLTREMVSITSLASQGEGRLYSKSDPQAGSI